MTRYPVISTDETPSLLDSLYSYSSLIGLQEDCYPEYSTDLLTGNIEHDCASGSFASLLQGSPDPLVRELIAIDTLLKELNRRITIQFSRVTVWRIFLFYPFVLSNFSSLR